MADDSSARNGNRLLITSLVLAIIVLVGAVMFLLGRLTAPQACAEPVVAEETIPPSVIGPVSEAPIPVAALPAAFQGRWEEDVKSCGDPASTTWLRLTAGELRFHESSGTIKAVTVYSPLDVAVTADWEGEGERWTRTLRLLLSPDQTVLTDPSEKGGFSRRRCPG
jgi:hypothetical protein